MYNLIYQNGIYPETVAIGNLAFSSAQLSSLQAIAAQCPLSGGEAVLRARDMLALSPDAPVFYNDAIACGSGLRPSQERIEQVLDGHFVQVRPNPASESITIKYELSDGLSHQFVLVNIFGQVVANVLLNGEVGETNFSVSNLSPGVYWYTVIGSKASSTSGKIIINR